MSKKLMTLRRCSLKCQSALTTSPSTTERFLLPISRSTWRGGHKGQSLRKATICLADSAASWRGLVILFVNERLKN